MTEAEAGPWKTTAELVQLWTKVELEGRRRQREGGAESSSNQGGAGRTSEPIRISEMMVHGGEEGAGSQN